MSRVEWNSRRLRSFRVALADWYARSRRDLPWRRDADPYRVWISEIMLQQTRVAAAIPYYERFLRRFPTVKRLARARESSVLAAWSGLGYYRRARLLHRAAREIARAGAFPRTLEGWRALPGIGAYTAAAIASIACGVPAAAVDGNVERVLRRITGRALTGKEVGALAGALLDPAQPGDHNQAMMELGATLCTPKTPQCSVCPVAGLCATRGVEPASKQAARVRRDVAYALSRRNGSVFLVQRPADATLMAGMWELPALRRSPRSAPLLTLRHAITTTDFTVAVHTQPRTGASSGRWVPLRGVRRLPLTGLTRKILRRVEALI